MANILVVDDELGIRDLLREILDDEGHLVEVASNAAEARLSRLRTEPDLVLLDVWMPDTDGVTLLKEWATTALLTMPVIMMSGHATIDTAIEATRFGAQAFLEKPITLQKLLKAVEAGLSRPEPWRQPTSDCAAPLVAGLTEITSDMTSQAKAVPLVSYSGYIESFDKPLRDFRDEFEKAYFEYHLAREGGSMTRVADKTGLERTHLYRKLKQLGVDVVRLKKAHD
jgi:DNA-binding NtrC family response regulator